MLVPYKVTYQRQEKDGEGFTYKEAEPVFTNEFKVLPSPAPSVSPSVTPSEEPSGTPAASITPGQSGGKGNPGSSAGGSSSGTQTQNVKTADETPIAFYLLLFAASAILILGVLRKKRPVD